MKRNILILTLFLSALLPFICEGMNHSNHKSGGLGSSFSNSRPLFEDGKSWIIWHGDNFCTHEIINVEVVGDKMIDGIQCKVLDVKFENVNKNINCYYCYHRDDFPSQLYVFENEKKIYVYREDGPKYILDENGVPTDIEYGEPYFDLYMDYDHKVGDYSNALGTITDVQSLNFVNESYRTLISGDFKGDFIDWPKLWIEGIGSNHMCNDWERYYHPMMEFPTLQTETYLVKCSLNGVPIYDQSANLLAKGITKDFVSDIQGVVQTNIEDKFYNLQGIRVNRPQIGEIYIFNGRKVKY